ncbi:MAG TPA: hypothetical protein PK756_02480 [Piscinibacter sp.]|nr:hypothetical protein [Piscinibacter sp.]
MSTVLDQLGALLARFDEESYVALANRGLVRRARKDLEQQPIEIIESGSAQVVVAFGAQRIRFDHRGPAQAQCDCPATGMCQHILAAAMGLQKTLQASAMPAATDEVPTVDPLAPLQAALLALTAVELARHAGKAGYRWAWQYVQDLEPEHALVISGSQHLVLGLQRPRITLRYMGGGLDALIADAELAQPEKYRVAAVLAFQRAHGRELVPPEPTARQRTQALDLGKDHALAESQDASLGESRARLRSSLRKILVESVELGLTHLSRGIHERYSTLAVWAQGAEYHRLALLTRRIADHVELLLDRAGGADELRLLDEITIAHGLVSALEAAAAHGAAPRHLVGRARSRYEASASLELFGLGAQAWRSPAGYVGLTMVFWSPAEQAFMSCTDARPQAQRGFNAIARYKAAGPWAGLGAPAQTTGRRVVLQGAQVNQAGRISAADGTSATVLPIECATLIEQLKPWDSWTALCSARGERRASLLAEPEPMKDWVALRPARVGEARFDDARQTLIWPLLDGEGHTLDAELPFDEYSRHAIGRIERLGPAELTPGTLVIARLRASAQGGVLAEPLSLVRPGSDEACVDALHFDEAPQQGLASSLLERLKRLVPSHDAPAARPAGSPITPGALRDLRHELQRQAERGTAPESAEPARAELARHAERLADAGFTVFRAALGQDAGAGERLLRVNYLCLQCERLMLGESAGGA